MARRIVVICGHPDPHREHLGHALALTYARAARQAGHEVREITVADLEFPYLRTDAEWNHAEAPAALRQAQEAIAWADHLVIVFPLWMGTLPGMLKVFFEQVMRPGVAFRYVGAGDPVPALRGKSARVVVTMGMPGLAYRWWFGGHGVRGFNRNLLNFCGIKPVRTVYIGLVGSPSFRGAKWIEQLRAWGAAAE